MAEYEVADPFAAFATAFLNQSAQYEICYGNSFKKNSFLIIFNLIFILQILLGVLMTYQNIPWHFALAHQGNSILLFLFSISMWQFSKKVPVEK